LETGRGFQSYGGLLTRFPKIDAVWAQDDDIASVFSCRNLFGFMRAQVIGDDACFQGHLSAACCYFVPFFLARRSTIDHKKRAGNSGLLRQWAVPITRVGSSAVFAANACLWNYVSAFSSTGIWSI
jgi:hypothetical protein